MRKDQQKNLVVVTRHKNLIEYLREKGLVNPLTRVIEHASEKAIQGKHVIGVLPLRLAAKAASVTEIPLDLPVELRGRELTLQDIKRYAGAPITYSIKNTCDITNNAKKISDSVAGNSDCFTASSVVRMLYKFHGMEV